LVEQGGDKTISEVFRARLRRMKPDRTLRAIVRLRHEKPALARARAEQVRGVKRSARQGLSEIDSVLALFGGRRLNKEPDALGNVAIETTPAGIRALAEAEHVRAVLEDQWVRVS
jgi:hypothetical protein